MDAGSSIQLLALWAGSCTTSASVLTVTGATGGYTLTRAGVGTYILSAPVPTNSTAPAFIAGVTIPVVTMQQSGTYSAFVSSPTIVEVATFAVDGVTATDKNFSLIVWARTPEL